ncbi:Fe-S cluster assembly protein HesB [Candidatus Woesearchaeota archaeon]|nr:Fe-S cluster assembly protein HesB [Candidatus Woesearchaeota archaeon]
MITKNKIEEFQDKVLTYYQDHGRDLPWRHTTDPYAILVSEIMLQQTQVDRVISFYHRWLQQWPTVQSLAAARREDVLKAWMGLGYNNRAVRLHQCARVIVEQFAGDVLHAMAYYKEVPGIGPYTSHAVRIFAANEDLVTVDTNIRRIFIHEFGLPESLSDKELWAIAERCLPKGKSCDWHNALMDYGATLMTARRTGIRPKTRQSEFEGSDRQIRAGILRFILTNGKCPLDGLSSCCPDRERLLRILSAMIRDGIIVKRDSLFVLSE